MNASKHSRGGAGNDDISGLFSRFGAAGHAGDYQDFDPPALPARAAAPAAPPAPAPAPATVAPLRRPAQAGEAGAATVNAATPLAQLFQRLLQEGAAPARSEGPLRRLLPR